MLRSVSLAFHENAHIHTRRLGKPSSRQAPLGICSINGAFSFNKAFGLTMALGATSDHNHKPQGIKRSCIETGGDMSHASLSRPPQ